MRFLVEERKEGEPSWWLVDGHGEPVVWAGVTFSSLGAADQAAHQFRTEGRTARVEALEEQSAQWVWTAWLGPHCCVAVSCIPVDRREDALKQAERVFAGLDQAIGP